MPDAEHGSLTRVLIASSQGSETTRIANLLGQHPYRVVGIAENGIDACRIAAEIHPDVALLDEELMEMDGVAAAETIWLAAPDISVILISAAPEGIMRRAMRAGVKEILDKPVAAADLLKALESVAALRQKRQTQAYAALLDPHLMPRVIAVTGAKGGIGKTTLSTNLAVTLAMKHPGETAMVDLHSQYGDVPIMLNLRPKRTLLDMLPLIDDIDEELVEAHLTEHRSGLKVLPCGTTPADLNALSTRFLGVVLNCLKRRYRLVVMDVPCLLYEATLYALTHATAVVLVANLFDLTTLQDTSKLYAALREQAVPVERVHLVLNRLERRNRLQAARIQQALGQPIWATVPNAGHIVVNAINEGVPFVMSHPQAPISRCLSELADRLENGILT